MRKCLRIPFAKSKFNIPASKRVSRTVAHPTFPPAHFLAEKAIPKIRNGHFLVEKAILNFQNAFLLAILVIPISGKVRGQVWEMGDGRWEMDNRQRTLAHHAPRNLLDYSGGLPIRPTLHSTHACVHKDGAGAGVAQHQSFATNQSRSIRRTRNRLSPPTFESPAQWASRTARSTKWMAV